MPAAIAARLGLKTSGGQLVADLVSYLRPRRLLLLLDNAEQVIGAAPLVAELLAAAPGLVILITSRTVLRLTGEYDLSVPPLPVPPVGLVSGTADLLRYPSVQLFVERARAAAPGFELTTRNAQAIAGICRALDGLPMAIELAAARIRLLPPQALLARLDDRMSVLTAGPRDLPERQRTLRSTLDWSFGLLSAEQKTMFPRLAVFVGPFDLPAAQAIGDDAVSAGSADEPARVMETMGSLVDSSLVRLEPNDNEPRFSLLETVREYALERLRDSGHWEGVHDRHAAYFAALARPVESELRGPGQLEWLNRLELRHDNLSAALSWLLERDQPGPALDLIWATWRFWWLHGHAEELLRYADKILARSDGMPPLQRAQALTGPASLTWPAVTRPRPGGCSSRACRYTPRPATSSAWAWPRPPWATCWPLMTRARSPPTCSSRPSSSCGRSPPNGSPAPSACSTCWMSPWRPTSSARYSWPRENTTTPQSCSPTA